MLYGEKLLCLKAAKEKVPLNGILELSPLCNMNCDMCFVRLSSTEVRDLGGLRSVKEWIAVAEEMKKAGTLFLLLTGGEPLLYPGFQELYIHLKKMGMILTINTNGTLIDEEWAKFFSKYKPRRINITLYGKDENTYERMCHYKEGFHKTIRAIELLKQYQIDVKINGSITPHNKNDYKEIIAIADSYEIPWKMDTYMYPGSRERKKDFNPDARLTSKEAAELQVAIMRCQYVDMQPVIDDFSKKASKAQSMETLEIPCQAGTCSFAINWQGMMRPCIMVTKPEVSVFSNDFMTAWNRLTKEVEQIRLSAKCNTCKNNQICQTCAACAYLETGRYDGTPAYMCQKTEHLLEILTPL